VKDYPRLTGCARDLQGRYRGIDQQGNIMPQISQSDCKRWLNGERLFDYTRDPNKVNSYAPVPTQTDNKESRNHQGLDNQKSFLPQSLAILQEYDTSIQLAFDRL